MGRCIQVVAALWLAGCGSVDPIAPPESSSDGFGTTEGLGDTDTNPTHSGTDPQASDATGADGGTSTSGDCPRGEEGCACLPEAACADGLLCATDLCVPPPSCDEGDVGTEGCPCTPDGMCEPDLICASELCVMPSAVAIGVLVTHSDFSGAFAID